MGFVSVFNRVLAASLKAAGALSCDSPLAFSRALPLEIFMALDHSTACNVSGGPSV